MLFDSSNHSLINYTADSGHGSATRGTMHQFSCPLKQNRIHGMEADLRYATGSSYPDEQDSHIIV